MADQRPNVDIAELVSKHHRAVFGYAYRLSGSVPDAEDLSQQVFLVAQQKLGQLRKVESAKSWLFAILRNCFLKSRQRQRPVAAANLQLDVDTIPNAPPKSEDIDRERLQQALDELPEAFRIVLVLFYFEQCSYKEIAEKLELPIGTVMSRLARAKSHLRAKLFAAEEVGRVSNPSTQ
jgi:RNA polymerase sigma-70 factor (ECF subfamily)